MKPQLSDAATVAVGSNKPIAPATIYYFDLLPVLPRLGSGGISHPERLRAICERHVRSVAGSDLVLFVENGFYLVVTSCGQEAAAGLASFINMSLLMLLFGTDQLSPEQNITLYRQVEADDLPGVASLKMQDLAHWQFHDNTPGEMGIVETIEEFDDVNGTTFTELAQDGIYVDQGVELAFFPVHDLRRKAVSALFCAPTFAGAIYGHQAFQNLSPALLPYIDRAILTHSLRFARRLTEAGVIVAVGVPVSFETLAWSKSREIYQRALRAAHISQNAQLILKLEDVPVGTPAERIAQIVSSLRPFARHIFVHLPNNRVELTMAGRIGASGLVLSLQRRAALPEVLADSKWLSRAAIAQNAMSCIDHVESDEALGVVRSSAIRFVVGHVFGGETLRGTASTGEVHAVLKRIEAATVAHMSTIV